MGVHQNAVMSTCVRHFGVNVNWNYVRGALGCWEMVVLKVELVHLGYGVFSIWLGEDCLLSTTRDPIGAAARILYARGYTGHMLPRYRDTNVTHLPMLIEKVAALPRSMSAHTVEPIQTAANLTKAAHPDVFED